MKIGGIGTGNAGRSIAGLLLRAGHEVRFGSRGGGERGGGLPAPSGTVAEAAGFGDAVLCAAPYGAWPELARDFAPRAAGKVVIDAANPHPQRDGAFAREAVDAGGGAGAPLARLVRAFNCVPWPAMVAEADRPPGERSAIPLAGDDAAARGVTAELVRDAGFEPVDAGPLAQARGFDPGAPDMRRTLGLPEPAA